MWSLKLVVICWWHDGRLEPGGEMESSSSKLREGEFLRGWMVGRADGRRAGGHLEGPGQGLRVLGPQPETATTTQSTASLEGCPATRAAALTASLPSLL